MTTMIGLGVGIDYSLLVVTRFREELGRGLRRREAAVNTMVTAGSAVITSGLTVVVGFGALLFTPLIETRSVGIGGLIVVAVAVLLSITLLPALLAVLGREIDRPRVAGPATHLVPRAAGLGEMGAHAVAPPDPGDGLRRRRRSRSSPPRSSGSGSACRRATGGPPGPRRARDWRRSRGWAWRGTCSRSGCWWRCRRGGPRCRPCRLRGLRTLSDSLRADPRVREVRSLVDLAPGTSLLGYSVLYSDMEAARAQYPSFVDAYLSARPAGSRCWT